MILYQRNKQRRLLILRLLFCVLAACVFVAGYFHRQGLVWLLAIIMMGMLFITLHDIIVTGQYFRVSKYYCFGLIKRTWQFNKQDVIRVNAYGADFGQDAEDADIETEDVGCLYSFFFLFTDAKITTKKYKIEQLNELGDTVKRVHVYLSKVEWEHLQKGTH